MWTAATCDFFADFPPLNVAVDKTPETILCRRFGEYSQGVPFRQVRARSHHRETLGMVGPFHQSLNYEEIWPNDYEDPLEAQMRIAIYREHYNQRRPHQALDYGVPAERYCRQALREVEKPATRYTLVPTNDPLW